MTSRSLVVKVTAGKDDQERCNQAFTIAATGVVALPHAAPLAQLLARVLEEGTVTVCSQCASRRDISAEDTIKGVRIAGASTFLAEVMADGTQALVY